MGIVQLHSKFEYKKHLCLVLESLEMDLRECLHKFGKNVGLSLDGVRIYAKQIFQSLAFLKSKRVVHADFKLDNIMVQKDNKHIKLCDLGSALYLEECGITEYLVSRYYRSPEIILGLPYDYSIDLWSAGVTLFEIYTGKIMFPGKTNNEMLKLIMRVKGKVSNKMIKKGRFSSQHFNEHFQFMTEKVDPTTKIV